MSPDWSCTVLVHNRTYCRKYRILWVLIDLCNSLISGLCPVNAETDALIWPWKRVRGLIASQE